MIIGQFPKLKEISNTLAPSVPKFYKNAPKHDENASNNDKVLKRSVGYVVLTTIVFFLSVSKSVKRKSSLSKKPD